MKTRSYLLFVALSTLAAACKPIIHGGGTGGSGATGGSASTGFGGSTCDGYMGGAGGTGGGGYDPCSGLSCGDPCSPCPPGADCAVLVPADLYCDANGQCSEGVPVCGPPQCSTDSDCVVDALCVMCPDGSTSCETASCVNGQCVVSDTGCPPPPPPPPPACTSDADCAVPQVCEVCPDGTTVCASSACVDGVCQTITPACPGN